jgi:hypothetical protein
MTPGLKLSTGFVDRLAAVCVPFECTVAALTYLGCLLDPPAPYSGQSVAAAAGSVIRHELCFVAGGKSTGAETQQGTKGRTNNLQQQQPG